MASPDRATASPKLFDSLEQEAYLHQNALADLDERWFDDWALVYDYGALVWEQLRQKVGDDALAAGLHDFYLTYPNQAVGYDEFIDCMGEHTKLDVGAFLDPWTHQNARINLVLQDVDVQLVGESSHSLFECRIPCRPTIPRSGIHQFGVDWEGANGEASAANSSLAGFAISNGA